MSICSKCNIDKLPTEFETYWHSTQQKLRTRRICNTCTREQRKLYKEMVKNKKIIQPEVPELQPDTFENKEGYIKCFDCKKWKNKELEFYINKKNGCLVNRRCRKCKLLYEKLNYKNKTIKDTGSERVLMKPNDFDDNYQKEYVHRFLELCGWEQNDEEVWYKLPYKDKTGKWLMYGNTPTKDDIVVQTDEFKEKKDLLISYKEKGMRMREIARKTGLNEHKLYYWFKKWKI